MRLLCEVGAGPWDLDAAGKIWEERKIAEGLATQVDLPGFVNNRPHSNSAALWGAPSPPQIYAKSHGSASLAGQDDVFSRMKTFRFDNEDSSQVQKSTFNELNSGMKDVPAWLKSLRLHKYSQLFAQMSYEEMMQLTEDKLTAKGVTVGARRKIALSIQKLKDRVLLLKQLEKDLIDVSRVPATLSELRIIITTPIKPKRVDTAENEDIAVNFTRTLVRACSYLLSSPISPNGSLDSDCFSVAVHIIERCLNHEAFMPQQKKRLASLKQELKRLWTPHHHKRFSLHNQLQQTLHFHPQLHGNHACLAYAPTHGNTPLLMTPSLCSAPAMHCAANGRRVSCDVVGATPAVRPGLGALGPNSFFYPPLNQQMVPTTSAQNVDPISSFLRQNDVGTQSMHQLLQRTASAPHWGSGASLLPHSHLRHQQAINNPFASVRQMDFKFANQNQSQQLPINQRKLTTLAPSSFDVVASKPLENGAADCSGQGTFSPWSSFYNDIQRSAWSCKFGSDLSAGSTGDSLCSAGSSAADATAAFLSALAVGQTSTASSKPTTPLFAAGCGSSAAGVAVPPCGKMATSPPSSFGEYSIDQLCRSMLEALDCSLAMAYTGADGATKKQINEKLFGKLDDEVIYENLRQLSEFLNKSGNGYTLNIANRAFGQKSFEIVPAYQADLKKNFNSDLCPLDFALDAPGAVRTINGWVSEKTMGKIPKLFEQLDPLIKLVLVNAIYFKGDWLSKFDQSQTVEKPFHVTSSQSKNLPTMHAKSKRFLFASDDKCQVLGLPYVNEDLSMIFVLPKERFGLASLEQTLNGRELIELLDKMHKREVEVQMPKFKLEVMLNLVNILQALGMESMFSHEADFSKISHASELYVSDVVHKAFLEVNEEGATAAAATGVSMAARSMPPPAVPFIADHPFLFAIMEKQSKTLLFLGHFYG